MSAASLTATTSRVLVRLHAVADARCRLVCFPYAGGGAPSFRELAHALPPDVDVVAVHPPGRGHRLREPPSVVAEPITRDAVEALLALTRGGEEVSAPSLVLYGHSMGALLAFEVAHALVTRGQPVAHLAVAARAAPHLAVPTPHAHALPDDELVELVRSYGTTPTPLLDNRELLAALLPSLRADLELSERYRASEPAAASALPCPITALRGLDDVTVDEASMAAWAMHTRARFELRTIAGGHLFLRSHTAELAALLRPLLGPAVGRGAEP